MKQILFGLQARARTGDSHFELIENTQLFSLSSTLDGGVTLWPIPLLENHVSANQASNHCSCFHAASFTLAAAAQQAAIGFCALDKTLDFKTAKAGDKIALHLTRDLVVKGKTLLPHGTALSATVADVKDGNTVSIVLDKATPNRVKRFR